ncbi:MAG TPA: DUF2933 domain-containing protein [Acidimicrobiales bacterium]|nr:DUF2933 domain-containing protein [Acidimicrobiales bacterium]
MSNYQRFLGPGLVVVAVLAVATALGAPILTYLPVAVVALACPLMMIFMMKGMHGSHGESHEPQATPKEGDGR